MAAAGWIAIQCGFAVTLAAADEFTVPKGATRVEDHNGHGYEPFEVEGARLVPRVEHLRPGRDWERMDVYVPETAKPGDRLPCIVNVYGGGYGQKGVGTMRPVVGPLVERGYVVACPDYALGVHAPEATAAWDVANAVRHLRANAAEYHVDPERIGLCGWSAGGWIAQFIGYGGPEDIRPFEAPVEPGYEAATPTIEPHPLHAEQPITLQAIVSDWGAGKLVRGRGDEAAPHESLTTDDPPLLTCFQGRPRELPGTSIGFLQHLSIAAEPVFLGDVRSTHVPKFDTPGWTAEGKPTTWENAIYDFFDRTVKHPPRSSPPQIVPVVEESVEGQSPSVRLLSVHTLYGNGAVHYTIDGSEPTLDSPRYTKPVSLRPGQSIRAIAVKPDLPPSGVATYTVPRLPRPFITTNESSFLARVGEPFRVDFDVDLSDDFEPGALWAISGRIGEKYKPAERGRPRTIPWLSIDRETGVLSGTPREPGAYPIIVTAVVTTDTRGRLDRGETTADARHIVITVAE